MKELMTGIQNAVTKQLNQRLAGLERMLGGSNLSAISDLEQRLVRMEKSIQEINSVDQSVS